MHNSCELGNIFGGFGSGKRIKVLFIQWKWLIIVVGLKSRLPSTDLDLNFGSDKEIK